MKQIFSFFINLFSKGVRVKKNRIMFETGLGKANDNPRAMYDYFKKEHSDKVDLKFIVTNGTDIKGIDNLDIVYRGTIKYLWIMMTSKVWFRSQSMGSIVKKKPNQIYIQLWHGDNLKREGYDRLANTKHDKPRMTHTSEWDYLVTRTKFYSDIMKSATSYDGKIIEMGLPRYDFLTTDAYRNSKNDLLDKFAFNDNVKNVILYAPTYRDWEDTPNLQGVTDIVNILPPENVLLLRLHPHLLEYSKTIKLPENVVNVTDYNNIEELYIISDCLITDYSSVFYDYFVNNDNIGWYIYDEEQYYQERGNNYISYDELPGWVARTPEELQYNLLKNMNGLSSELIKKNKSFRDRYFYNIDGLSSQRIADYTIETYIE